MKIGVLAEQGAFAEHISILNRLGASAFPVRLPADLDGLDGLVIPGGESTTICGLMNEYAIAARIRELGISGMAIMGTCAGMIVLSKKLTNNYPEPLGLMDITVKRNAFGRQRESFETELAILVLGDKPFPAVFIRAPLIDWFDEKKVDILARLEGGQAVAARQGKIVVSAFHPELTSDSRFHQYFLDVIAGKQ